MKRFMCLWLPNAPPPESWLRKLAFFAQRYSPLVAVDAPECLLLDVSGCGHLFGGDRALANKVVRDLRTHQLAGRTGIADTIGAAWALAHAGESAATVAPVGKHRNLLGPLDIALLRVPGDVVQRLREFDLCSVQQLQDLPRAELLVRFGRPLLLRLDQALGDVPEVLCPERFVEPVAGSWTFDDATARRDLLEEVFEHLLDRMLQRIVPDQLGIERLTCTLTAVNQEQIPLSIGLLEPTDSQPYLMELLRLRLENVRLSAEIGKVSLHAVVGLRCWKQGRLARQGDKETRRQGDGALSLLVERLSSRVGERAVLRPYLRPEAQPEYSWGYAAWIGREKTACGLALTKSHTNAKPQAARHPVTLSPCHPVTMSPSAAQFVWHGRSYIVARMWGPQRIETGWWRGRDVRRDYYRVETQTGERFWLFRDLQRGGWFVHGVYG